MLGRISVTSQKIETGSLENFDLWLMCFCLYPVYMEKWSRLYRRNIGPVVTKARRDIQHNNWYSYWHVQLFLMSDQSWRLSAPYFQSPPFIKVKTKNEAVLMCAYNPTITSLCLTLFQRRTRHTSNTPSKLSICLTSFLRRTRHTSKKTLLAIYLSYFICEAHKAHTYTQTPFKTFLCLT